MHARTKWVEWILWIQRGILIHSVRIFMCVFRRMCKQTVKISEIYVDYTSARMTERKIRQTVQPVIFRRGACSVSVDQSIFPNFYDLFCCCCFGIALFSPCNVHHRQLKREYVPFSIRFCSFAASSAVKSPFFTTTICGASSSKSDRSLSLSMSNFWR